MPSLFPDASQWIASHVVGSLHVMAPAPYLRSPVWRLDAPVRSAWLTVTALGLFEAEINGQPVSDDLFAPGWTDYRRRVLVRRYEVSALLREGENRLGAILGDGWYSGRVGMRSRQTGGTKPLFRAALVVELADGSSQVIVTDSSWETRTGPILENDLIMGEAYDARLELPGWSLPGDEGEGWVPVSVESKEIELTLSDHPPVRRQEQLTPVEERRLPDGTRLFDLGQNISGRVRLRVKAAAGRGLILRHAEILNPDGTPYYDNLREARATDFYTCKGSGEEGWEPRFTFHGFRYAVVSGLKQEDQFSLVGIVIHTEMEERGSFASSHPLLNRLHRNIAWGLKGNFLEVPTDCPQRDERLGWTGDAQVFIRTACFHRDVRGFFRKWFRDLRDAQRPSGAIPQVVPDQEFPGYEDGGPAWSDAMIICPWTIYLCYGDLSFLKENYEAMRRYLDFLLSQQTRDGIRSHPDLDPWGGYGDWLASESVGELSGRTPRELIGTAYLAYDLDLMAKSADLLGKFEEAERWRGERKRIVAAFQRRFLTAEGLVAGGTQTGYVLALRFGLIPEENRAEAVAELVRDIERRNFHLSTGFVGTPYLLGVLEEGGRLDVAYRLLEQESYPSWLFQVTQGATTVWERWDGWTPERGFQDENMNSFNHYAFGAVGEWLVSTVAGIDLDPHHPGGRHFLLRPRPGGSLTHASAAWKLDSGTISIRWELQESGQLLVEAEVPPGVQALFSPPPGYGEPDTATCDPGQYRWKLEKR